MFGARSETMELWTEYLSLLVPMTLGLIIISRTIIASLSKLPPGPWKIPVIGNLHQLGKKPHFSLSNQAQIHGPIMSLKLGQVTAIIISSASAAKQVMQKQDHLFANRAVPDTLTACNHSDSSVVWLPLSSTWRESRKVMSSQIFNSQKLEASGSLRRRKVEELVEAVGARCKLGEGVLIGEAAFKTTFNVLLMEIFSMDLDSEKSKVFKESFRKVMELAGTPNIVDYFPWLRRFDPQRMRAQMEIQFDKMLAFLDSVISERLTLRAEQGSAYENKDVLDTLLDTKNTVKEINGEVIRQLLMDLFIAGTDTTSITVEWAMSEIMKNQDVISKAKDELAENIGRGKLIQEADISQLPYLQAIIKETLRLHPPAPLLLPRKTLEEVELWDYKIPKGAQVMINVWAIGRDPSTWDDPKSFKPERFINSDVDFRGGNFELIPFGAGRRICPGLNLAHKMIHLMVGSLINCFDWKLDGDGDPKDIDMDEKLGITLQKTVPLLAVPLPI